LPVPRAGDLFSKGRLMGKVQTRKAISVRGDTYAKVRARAAVMTISMSDFVEQAIAAELKRCGYFEGSFRCGAQAGETGMCGSHVGMVPSLTPVARAVAAVLREGDRQVERAAIAVQAAAAAPATAPSRRPEFRLRAGQPSNQQRMFELIERHGPISTVQLAELTGATRDAASVACGKWAQAKFIEGYHGAWRVAGAPVAEAALPAPLPSESSIKVGPPPEQTAMLGRAETTLNRARVGAKRLDEPSLVRSKDEVRIQPSPVSTAPARGSAWRGQMAPRPEEAEARRAARTAAPPPIPKGTDRAMPGRPAGLHVEAAKPRSLEEMKQIVKVDPIAAVHTGRAGVQF